MRLNRKSLSKVSLMDLLKRRRSNLTKFLSDTGIVTYELLVERCNSMGVIPPDESFFFDTIGRKQDDAPAISSPAEGVVILNPPTIISEKSGLPVTNFPDLEKIVEESLPAGPKDLDIIPQNVSDVMNTSDSAPDASDVEVESQEYDSANYFRSKKKKPH